MRLLGRLLLIAMLPVAVFADSAVYLNDNFNDNDRSNENLPGSGAWFRSFNNLSVVEVSTGDYALQNQPTSATVRHAVTYFAPTNTPVSLASAGDRLTVSFEITPTSKAPDDAFNVLRVALLDSGSARVSGDNDNPKLTLNGGYGFFSNTHDSRTILWSRSNSTEANLVSSTTGWGTSFGDQTASSVSAMVQGTTYTITTEIVRLADDNVSIDYTVSDGTNSYTLSYLDVTYQYYSFDTFVVGWGGAFGVGTIDNVSISTDVAELPTTISHGATDVSMDFVTIGDPGNADHATYGMGGVDYEYRIGTYEVTADQWETVAAADANIGDKVGLGSKPAAKVSWNEGAKFCNWLTSGNAYTGAYQFDGSGTLTNVDRAAALSTYTTVYVLPTEDEWAKGAYYTGVNLSIYPNGTITAPSHAEANYSGGIGSAWDVGSGIAEQNGTYDMGGNLQEWLEDAADGTLDDMTEDRLTRGGAYNFSFTAMKLSTASSAKGVDYESNSFGIRVVELTAPEVVPDPTELFIVDGPGSVTVNVTNLIAVATNQLLFKSDLTDAAWSNLYSVTGVTETNWAVLPGSQGFYRIETTY